MPMRSRRNLRRGGAEGRQPAGWTRLRGFRRHGRLEWLEPNARPRNRSTSRGARSGDAFAIALLGSAPGGPAPRTHPAIAEPALVADIPGPRGSQPSAISRNTPRTPAPPPHHHRPVASPDRFRYGDRPSPDGPSRTAPAGLAWSTHAASPVPQPRRIGRGQASASSPPRAPTGTSRGRPPRWRAHRRESQGRAPRDHHEARKPEPAEPSDRLPTVDPKPTRIRARRRSEAASPRSRSAHWPVV